MKSDERTPRRNRRRARPEATVEAVEAAAPGRLRAGLSGLGERLNVLKRPLLLLMRLALVGVIAVGAVAVGQLVEQHVRTSPAFATAELEVEGLERLDRAEVLATAGLAMGRNVFEVSPEAAEAALLAHPWVSAAQVSRRLPGSYAIQLQERQASAIAVLDGLYLVGDDAAVFKRHTADDPVDLPIVTGLQDEVFVEDPLLRSAALVSAVALLHDYRDVGLWRREPIAEIHIAPDGSLSLYAGEQTTHVRLGKRPFRTKLRRFRKVLDRLRAQDARPAYVYLDNARRPDRVTVRLK